MNDITHIFSLLPRFITGTSRRIFPPTPSHLNEMIFKPILVGIPPYIIKISLDKEVLSEDIRHVRLAMYPYRIAKEHIRKAYLLTI